MPETPVELPSGWVETSLGEVTAPLRERVPPTELPQMRYIGLEHIESQTMKLLGYGYARDIRSSSVRFLKGDVLYGKMRPYLNKVWVAEFDGLCSAEFLVFREGVSFDSEFLALRLNSDDFVAFADSQVSGERPRVDFEKLSPFPILLPPVAEQKRIVIKLNTILTGIQRAKAATQRAHDRLERYRSAVLQAAVTGELTKKWRAAQRKSKSQIETSSTLLERLLASRRAQWESTELQRLRSSGKPPKDEHWKSRYPEPSPPEINDLLSLPETWAWASIDQLSWDSGYGTSVKCTYDAKGPAVLRIPNVRNRTLDFNDLKFAVNPRGLGEDAFVKPGDFLLIRTNGSKDLIGRAAVAQTSPTIKCSFASYLIRFRFLGKETLWSWLALAWDSPLTRLRIETKAVTTAGQYNVSLTRLSGMAIPLPPQDEQEEIVRMVTDRLLAAARLAATLKQQLIRAQATRQSLLREAFIGHLVPQDPNEATLSALPALRDAEAAKPKVKRMPKLRSKSPSALRPLLEVLREHQKPMTPEQLFVASGYQEQFERKEHRQEVVDSFYEELRQLVGPSGPVLERRPDQNTVLLEVK